MGHAQAQWVSVVHCLSTLLQVLSPVNLGRRDSRRQVSVQYDRDGVKESRGQSYRPSLSPSPHSCADTNRHLLVISSWESQRSLACKQWAQGDHGKGSGEKRTNLNDFNGVDWHPLPHAHTFLLPILFLLSCSPYLTCHWHPSCLARSSSHIALTHTDSWRLRRLLIKEQMWLEITVHRTGCCLATVAKAQGSRCLEDQDRTFG